MPMLTGLAGGMANSGKSNPWSVSGGMIVGMGMGIADELNHYLAGNNAYYLSSGVMGAATASNLPLPHYVNQLCGFVVGALAAGGYLNGLEKYGGALVSGAVNGAILGGMAGAGAGGVAGLADEVMSICDLTDNKPLSTALSGVTQLKILGPMVSSGLGHLPLIGQAYSEMVHQFTVPYLLESAGVVWAGFCLFTQGHNGVLSYLCTTMEPFQRESAHSDLELVQGMDASLAEIVDEDFIQKMSRIQALTIILNSAVERLPTAL
ncbi:hypothetical protein GZ77_09665 [Endozoicomonas montiporae]|uniref:Uncharacterized protein n=3 Tax=Endozoicomonas montiporae TaxID=1027273 RepID=A0A081N811_9GAMM|nr:hypothetical protein [Endozoicomonas montiporae]KEQ14584.1 hypothetical protein GZ77_09665 [Endozoicomonas montiporae]